MARMSYRGGLLYEKRGGRGEGKCVGGGKGNKEGGGVRKGKLKGKNDSGKGYCSRKGAGHVDPWHW